jgi:organic hydroperoxide reductase OsmC/OhrA
MHMIARVHNSEGEHHAEVSAGKHAAHINIASKPAGFGSSVSGGELLMLAMATCYCNDIYREAGKMGMQVTAVEVECEADFPAEGAPAQEIKYTARITARASDEQIRNLAAQADAMAEIQNTVRNPIPVRLAEVLAQTV